RLFACIRLSYYCSFDLFSLGDWFFSALLLKRTFVASVIHDRVIDLRRDTFLHIIKHLLKGLVIFFPSVRHVFLVVEHVVVDDAIFLLSRQLTESEGSCSHFKIMVDMKVQGF